MCWPTAAKTRMVATAKMIKYILQVARRLHLLTAPTPPATLAPPAVTRRVMVRVLGLATGKHVKVNIKRRRKIEVKYVPSDD